MTLAAHFQERAAEFEKNCDAHPSLETLTDYALGDLEEAEAEELRAHLARCRTCSDQFLTIQEPLDFELDFSLTEEAETDESAATAAVPVDRNQENNAPADPAPRRRFAMFLPVAAALVVGLLIGIAAPLNRGNTATPLYHQLETDEVVRAGHIQPLFFGDGQDEVHLIAFSFDPKGAETVDIFIKSDQAGKRKKLKTGLVPPPGLLAFSVSRKAFQAPGVYRIDVARGDNNDANLATFLVRYQKGP
nr:zf-HC2 domain-containing protein [Acanthopleuribacter pedis]